MNRKALYLALSVGILGVFLMVLYQRRFEIEASGGEKIRLLVARVPIERGKVITDDMLVTRDVPQAYVEDRAVKEVEKAKVLGLRVGNLVQAQQTLMWTDLVTASEERRDLSGLVQPGNRAVSIRTAREESSIALVRPGDYVDVIGVMAAQTPGGQPTPNEQRAAVLLQRVLVLAAGMETSPDAIDPKDKRNDRDTLLTLSLTVPEAQLLALAAEKGRITVALRNPDDQRTAEHLPDINTSSLFDSTQRDSIKGIRRAGGPTRIPEGAAGSTP